MGEVGVISIPPSVLPSSSPVVAFNVTLLYSPSPVSEIFLMLPVKEAGKAKVSLVVADL